MKNRFLKVFLSLSSLLLSIGLFTTFINATSIINEFKFSPSQLTYTLNQEDFKFDEIKHKNETKSDEHLVLTVKSYDTKTSENLETKPFIALEESEYTVKPNTEISIPTLSSIPKDTPVGTYYNVVYVQNKVLNNKGKTISTTAPVVAVLVTFNVQSATVKTDEVFFDQSDTTLRIVKKGLPYIMPTEFEYTYKNNSNFVFTPSGEIKITDEKGNQVEGTMVINQNKKMIYPGESFTQKYSVNLWNNLTDVLGSKSILGTTISDIDGTPILNKVDVSILYQSIIIAIIAVLVVVAIIATCVALMVKVFKKKDNPKKKVSEKSSEMESSQLS